MLKNTTSFVTRDELDPTSSDYFCSADGYAFYLEDLRNYFSDTTYGVFSNPYTSQEFSTADKARLQERLGHEADIFTPLLPTSTRAVTISQDTLDAIYNFLNSQISGR